MFILVGPDPCDEDPCDVNAVCERNGFDRTCQCNTNYYGDGETCKGKTYVHAHNSPAFYIMFFVGKTIYIHEPCHIYTFEEVYYIQIVLCQQMRGSEMRSQKMLSSIFFSENDMSACGRQPQAVEYEHSLAI